MKMLSVEKIIADQPVIGLFGTCGNSTFRQDTLVPQYESLGIRYFNPQVPDWNPELAKVESDHLALDQVQCWPVTDETYGTGSLAEQGYSLAQSMGRQPNMPPLQKFIIPMISATLRPELNDEVARKESLRARALAIAHLEKNPSPNVFVAESLQHMLEISIQLYKVAEILSELAKANNPAYLSWVQNEAKRTEELNQAMRVGYFGKDVAKVTNHQVE